MLISRGEPTHHTALETPDTFRRLVDGIEDFAIYMLDGGGRVATWNPGAQRLKGYRPEEIIGRPYATFFPPEAVAAGRPARLLAIAAREGRAEDEGWRVRKDGSRFWADAIMTALRDAGGAVIGFAKVTRDMTAQRQAQQALRESEERFRLLVDAVKDYAIFMLDPDGRVMSWTPGAERIIGYRAEAIIGQHFSQFYPSDDAAQGKPAWELQQALAEGRHEDEGWRIRKDGSRFWANVVIAPVRDAHGALLGFAKVTRDLTRRRRDEESLAQANAELEKFSYSVSHDLRAPLRAISGYAELLLREQAGRLDEEGLRHLRVIRDSAAQGGELIDALLKFSRLGRQAMTRVEVDLTTVVRHVLDELQQPEEHRGVEVVVAPLPLVTGDPALLRMVFANLVGNAFKFSRGRPNRRVAIGTELREGEVVCYIRDNGVGFDMRFAEKLFGVFQRLHRADEFEGSGVGLALAQRIVQRHGGRIWADGKPNQGATFYFTIPATARRADDHAPTPTTADAKKAH